MERVTIIIDEQCKSLGVEGAMFCIIKNIQVAESSALILNQISKLTSYIAKNLEAITASPESHGYQDIMVKMGFSESVHAGKKLTRLVAKRGLKPICNVVDAYNIIAAKAGIPIGAHDLDTIKFPLYLTLAKENLKIKTFGNDKEKLISPGSLIYIDSCETPIANIGKKDTDSANHSVTRETVNVLFTIMQHHHFNEIDARNALTKVYDILKNEMPEIDVHFVNPIWAKTAIPLHKSGLQR